MGRSFKASGVSARVCVAGVLAGVLCLGLAGCERAEILGKAADKIAGEAKQALDTATNPKAPSTVNYNPLTVSSKVWSGSSALRLHRGVPLPSRYEDARGITLVSSDSMSLEDITSAVSTQTGIPVRLTSLTMGGRRAGPSPSGAAAGGASDSSTPDMPVSYEGPLSGLLDRLSAHFGVSWRFDGSAISISRYETRVFVVEALPGFLEVNEGMQDDAGSSGESGGSSSVQSTLTQNSKTTMELRYWDELSAVLNAIIGGQGNAIISPAMGTVTITTTPDIMSMVSDYVSKENKRLSRQIAINVQIYSVDLGQSEDFNVAFTGFLKNLSSFAGMSYTAPNAMTPINSALSSTGALGSFSIAIINQPDDPTVHAGNVFNALSTIGKASQVAQFPMTTLNNHPVSRRVGTDRSYISSVDAVTSTGTSTTTTYTPVVSTIHDGFSLQMTPRLLDDGRILLQYSLSLVGIDSMGATTFNQGDGSVVPLSLPTIDNRIFVQRSLLRSGQTLIIGGVDQRKIEQNKQGVGTPSNFLLGGGVSAQDNHSMMFIAITPQVMDVAAEGGAR